MQNKTKIKKVEGDSFMVNDSVYDKIEFSSVCFRASGLIQLQTKSFCQNNFENPPIIHCCERRQTLINSDSPVKDILSLRSVCGNN
jgi:hypothetical protein